MILVAVLASSGVAWAGEQQATTKAGAAVEQPVVGDDAAADVAAAAADAGADDGASQPLSEAETVLWTTDQLHSIEKPLRLAYEFKKGGTFEEGFTDKIFLDILELLPDGMKRANVTFFTGERYHYVPPYDSINGNPVMAVYLHGDVLEMNRLTEGHWRYFQRRIKFALADAAQIEPVSVEFGGKTVEAKRITIKPYANDPKRERNEKYGRFADKVYTFTISDAVPGYLYRIEAVVPAAKDLTTGDAPLLEESITLTAVEELPATGASGATPVTTAN
jgi:hypothetical protein